MRKLLILLTLTAFIGGIALAFLPFNNPDVANALAPLICPDGGTVGMASEAAVDGGINTSFTCTGADEIAAEAGFLPYLVLFSAWCWLPLLPALILIFTTPKLASAAQDERRLKAR
jgi:hypothetical protein